MNQEDWDRINEFAALPLADLCAISLGFERCESNSPGKIYEEWNRRITVAMNHIGAGSLQTLEKCSCPTYGHAILPRNESSLNIFLDIQVFMKWANGLGWDMPIEFAGSMNKTVGKWPWGDYETELLRHLRAAAERFWTLYDPSDPSSAPTSGQVTEWLVKQGVSQRTAEIMAQILRADGLQHGPRK